MTTVTKVLRWGVGVALSLALAGPAGSQAYKPPMIGGHPNLSGDWSMAWLTRIERSKDFTTLTVSEAEARAWDAKNRGKVNVSTDAVGQGESEFNDAGDGLARIAGTPRTSWIVDPADGKIPYRPEVAAWRKAQTDATEKTDFNDVSQRPLSERCLGTGRMGPPFVNGPDTNEIRIVQTRDHVAIVLEFMPVVRVIPFATGQAAKIPIWGGQSSARWDKATLVVETTAFHPLQFRGPAGSVSDTHKVTERFTRTGPDEIRYDYVIENPQLYTQPWRGEMVLKRGKGVYEYACHEGNYALPGILAGGQRMIAEAAEKPAQAAAAGTR